MNHAIGKTVTLLSTPSELRLVPTTASEPKRELPLGLAISLWLRKPMLFGAVLAAVAVIIIASSIRNGELPTTWPQANRIQANRIQANRIQVNRIHGARANSDQNNIGVLGIIMLAIGSAIFVSGVRGAFTTYELLKSGLTGDAVVTHYKKVKSGSTYELNGLSWKSKPNCEEFSLTDLHQQVSEIRSSQFDSQGKYIGTAALRTLNMVLAPFYGALVFGFLACVITVFNFGFPHVWIVLGSSCFGAAAMAFVEFRWRILLRGSEPPLLTKKRTCILQFHAINCLEPIRLEKELELKGDATDFTPHPILYLQEKPSKAEFLDAIELKYSVDPNGEQLLHADSPLPHALAMLLIVLSAIVGIVVVMFF